MLHVSRQLNIHDTPMAVSDWFHRKLAWSNTGSTAQIAKDGSKVTFRTIIRDQRTGSYSLSEPSKFPLVAPEGRQYVHLQFNGLGADLAVVDDQGAVHMYAVAGAIGRMQPGPGPDHAAMINGDRSDLDAVVGMHWLPLYPTEFRVSGKNPSL